MKVSNWGSAVKTHIDEIFRLQKRIVRIIHGVHPRTHSMPLFKNLGILNVKQLFSYNVGLFMYKYSHHWLSSIFNMFTKNSDIHQYYTRQSELLHIRSI